MSSIVPRALVAQTATATATAQPTKCQATVEDFENGTRYNLARVFITPVAKPCSRNAKLQVGEFCFCAQHAKLALGGLIDDDGSVATRNALRDVRKYPKKFPDGIYTWARSLTAKEIK
jgi:hypothetical protein